MGTPTNIPSEWLTADGDVINPAAPAGGGGAGNFRSPLSLGDGDPVNPAFPEPNAPAGRLTPSPAEPLDQVTPTVKPPPKTTPTVISLKKQQDAGNDIDVSIEVLPDVEDSSIRGEADTKPTIVGLKSIFPNPFTNPGATTISKFTSKFILKGKITIQIRYKPGTDKSAPSAYGRGTTTKDVADGNISVGFHESCHLNDHLTWMKANALPVFTGKVGMTDAEFDKACKDFGDAMDKYIDDDDKNTEALTDETGKPTRSQFLAGNRP